MGHITDAHETGAYNVYVYWQSGGPIPDPPGGGSSPVKIYLENSSRNTIADFSAHWSDGKGQVNLTPNTAAYAHVGDQHGHHYTEDHKVTTAAASQNSVSKERILGGNLGAPQDMSAVAAAHSDQRIFDLLVPEGSFIGHYVRQGTSGGWRRVDTLVLPGGQQIPDTTVSHIQSFTALDHLDALALLQPGGALVTFEYNPDTGKHQPSPVTVKLSSEHGDPSEPVNQVTGIPALVQTDQKLFHLLVPHQFGSEESGQPAPIRIAHLVHSNDTIQGPWDFVTALPPIPQGSGVVSIALTQADGLGSLKAVVRVTPPQGPDFLVSYQSDPNYNWQGPFETTISETIVRVTTDVTPHQPANIISNVAGSPGLAQSIFGDQEQLDLIVPIADPQTGTITLTQFTQPAGFEVSINQPWKRAATLQPLNNDAHTQVVSTSIIQDSHRDLQNIAHVMTPRGENLLAFYIFNPKTGWSKPAPVTKPNGKPIIVGHDNGPSDENGDNSDDHDDNGHENGHENGDPDHTPDS